MRVTQSIQIKRKKKKRINNSKTAENKFKYTLIAGQQTKPSRYKKKKIYSVLKFDVSIKKNFSQETRK